MTIKIISKIEKIKKKYIRTNDQTFCNYIVIGEKKITNLLK